MQNPNCNSYGHRNVQGLAFHPVTEIYGKMNLVPRGGDELNLMLLLKLWFPIITYGIGV
jgi:glucose/arabinose dehydrogenase